MTSKSARAEESAQPATASPLGATIDGALRTLVRQELTSLMRVELPRLLDELRADSKGRADDEFLPVKRAAALASVSPQTIRAWIRLGRLDPHRAGRVLRVRRQQILALLSSPSTNPTSSPDEQADTIMRRRRSNRS